MWIRPASSASLIFCFASSRVRERPKPRSMMKLAIASNVMHASRGALQLGSLRISRQ
jgi:hypothetical protein